MAKNPRPLRIQIPLRILFASLVIVGIGLRFVAMGRTAIGGDGGYYFALGGSLSEGRGLLLQWGSEFQGIDLASVPVHPWYQTSFEPVLSQHQAPLWPLALAFAYEIAGVSLATSSAASFAVSLLLLLTAFLTSKDLLGSRTAWFVTAFVALDFLLVASASALNSETLMTVFYLATIWAILRSLKDDRFVVFAGLFAGAGYLTRASIGYFFLLAGSIGFLWRFYYLRWGVFKNRYYLAAIGIFLAFVGVWGLRNLLTFGWPHWETSPYTSAAVVYGLRRPVVFSAALAVKSLLFLIFFAMIGGFFLPQILPQLRRYRDEVVSAHVLSIALPALLGVIFATAFALYERHGEWLNDGNLRYIDVAFVPLLWLALRREKLPASWNIELRIVAALRPRILLHKLRRNAFRLPLVLGAALVFRLFSHDIGVVLLVGAIAWPRTHELRVSTLLVFLLSFALASANGVTGYYRSPEVAAGEFLASVANEGDVVAVLENGDISLYQMYPYVAHLGLHLVLWNGSVVDFLLSDVAGNYSGYELLADFHTEIRPGIVDSAFGIAESKMREALGIRPLSLGISTRLFVYRGVGPQNPF